MRYPIQRMLSTGSGLVKKFKLEVWNGQEWMSLVHYRNLSKAKANFLYYLSQLMCAKMSRDINQVVRIAEDD